MEKQFIIGLWEIPDGRENNLPTIRFTLDQFEKTDTLYKSECFDGNYTIEQGDKFVMIRGLPEQEEVQLFAITENYMILKKGSVYNVLLRKS